MPSRFDIVGFPSGAKPLSPAAALLLPCRARGRLPRTANGKRHLILWRCPGSQPWLEALARRYEQEPLPRRGQRATPFYRLKLLTIDLAADWDRLTLTEQRRDDQGRRMVPATNKVSELSIGMNVKERYRTMRGYKSETSLRRVVTLSAYFRQEGKGALISALAA